MQPESWDKAWSNLLAHFIRVSVIQWISCNQLVAHRGLDRVQAAIITEARHLVPVEQAMVAEQPQPVPNLFTIGDDHPGVTPDVEVL